MYRHRFSVDVLPTKQKTWTRKRHNIIYAIYKLLPLLKKKIYFDVGANIGTHAWLCEKFDITTYCFEPNPELLEHIKTNGNPKEIFNCGLSDVNGIGYMDKNQASVGNSVYKIKDTNLRKIDLRRLDDIDVPGPGVIKYDVEGHEVQALSGSKDTVNESAPWIVIEHKYNREAIEEYLRDLDYKLHTDWATDSIWHRRDNPIPIEKLQIPSLDKDLRNVKIEDWL